MQLNNIPESLNANIDHVGIVGGDLASLIETYQRLGFSITPPQQLLRTDEAGLAHDLGQASAHIMFGADYIELTAPTGTNNENHLLPYLKRYSGLHILALASTNLDGLHPQLQQAGLLPQPIQLAQRKVAYGDCADAHFKWCQFDPEIFPEGLICFVEQLTPEVVFQDVMNDHANTAHEIHAVYVMSSDESSLSHYHEIDAGDASTEQLHFIDQQWLKACGVAPIPSRKNSLAGFQINVRSMQALRKVLRLGDVAFREEDESIWVMPSNAAGVLLHFTVNS